LSDQIRSHLEDKLSDRPQPLSKSPARQRPLTKLRQQIVKHGTHAKGRIGGIKGLQTKEVSKLRSSFD